MFNCVNDILDNVTKNYMCPISQRRLTEAVVILPCCCRVNKEVVQKIQGIALHNLINAAPGSHCPACSKEFVQYCEDPVTSRAVNEFFKLVDSSSLAIQIKEKPKSWVGPLPTYPGIRGNFVQTPFLIKNPQVCKGEVFKSTNASVLKSFTFTSNSQQCSLLLEFPSSNEFLKVIEANELPLENYHRQRYILFLQEPIHMRKMFEIIVANNDVPQGSVEKIRNILKTLDKALIPPPIKFN